MNSTLLRTILVSIGVITIAQAAPVTLNDWSETGGDVDNVFTGNGTAGFTETYGTESQSPVRYDSGAIATFASPVTLNSTTNQLQFSFTVSGITATGAGSNNMFRVGFENDGSETANDATIHYVFGYGDPGNRLDARFAGGSNSSNEYAAGTAFDANLSMVGATALDTGNTSTITARLTYLGDAGGGLYYYRADIDWDGKAHASSTFTRNTNTWDKVYLNMNSASVNVAGDTYTVSGTQVATSSIVIPSLSDVVLSNWVETGVDVNNAFTGNGAAGFTETYGSDTDTRFDSGARADFVSDVILDDVFNTLQFSFTVGNITATGGSNNAFRVGFENDGTSSATIHYVFGYGAPGDKRDARFAGASSSNNEYAAGTAFDADLNLAGATPLATGNTSNITVTLTYLGAAGGGLYNYQAKINWDGAILTSSTFTRNTNRWDKVYVLTNTNLINVSGDTYTFGNVQVKTGIPSTATDYDTWAGPSGFNLSGGPGDDDDSDGLTNSEEYAFGLNPTDPSSVSPYSGTFSKSTGLFQYTRRNPALRSTGLTYSYQYSTTLEATSWLSFTPEVNPPASNNGDPVETVTVDVPDALLANPKLFVRVVAE